VQQDRKAAPQKLHRLAFQLALPGLVSFENRTRRRAKRAVIQEDNLRIEQKQIPGQRAWTIRRCVLSGILE
jgi:predicted transcriptional regulator